MLIEHINNATTLRGKPDVYSHKGFINLKATAYNVEMAKVIVLDKH